MKKNGKHINKYAWKSITYLWYKILRNKLNFTNHESNTLIKLNVSILLKYKISFIKVWK